MGCYLCRSPCRLCSQHRKIQNIEVMQTHWFCGDCVRQKTEDSQWVKAFAVKSKGMVEGEHWLPQIVLWPSRVCSNMCVSMCVCTHINKINLIKKVFQNWGRLAAFQESCPPSLSLSCYTDCAVCEGVNMLWKNQPGTLLSVLWSQ